MLTRILGTFLIAAAALPAAAQSTQNCADRIQIVERLEGKYGETRQSIGLGSNNTLIEVCASPETGTWTITATMPQGVTCILTYGQSYEALAPIVTPVKGAML